MNINLHIERLVVDGIEGECTQGSRLQQSLERQLTLLLASGELGAALRTGGALPHLQAPAIDLAPATQPETLGQQIAGAIFGGLRK